MSSIKDRDLLRFLEGQATAGSIEEIKTWAFAELDNAQDLGLLQRIYKELPGLRSYEKIDAMWNKELADEETHVEAATSVTGIPSHSTVEDIEILRYLDGRSDQGDEHKIIAWAQAAPENQADIAYLERITEQSRYLEDYRRVSNQDEWLLYVKMRDRNVPSTATTVEIGIPASAISEIPRQPDLPVPPSGQMSAGAAETGTNRDAENTGRSSWIGYAVLAILLLLVGLWWWSSNSSKEPQTLQYATVDAPDQVTLTDGTTIQLMEHSEVSYFADYAIGQKRKVRLKGSAELDVSTVTDQPMEVVTVTDEGVEQLAVRAQGAVFSILNSAEFGQVIQSSQGSVQVYALGDTATQVTIHAGESYSYDGSQFVKLEPRVAEDTEEEYRVLYVLDQLMEKSGWRIITSPYTEFDGDDMIRINLDQPYEDILQDLVRKANFTYEQLQCQGCYRINRFKGE